MTVSELIEFLKTQPQDMPIAYECFSERVLMEVCEIEQVDCCIARPDGWVQNARPDKELITYLVFPGN